MYIKLKFVMYFVLERYDAKVLVMWQVTIRYSNKCGH